MRSTQEKPSSRGSLVKTLTAPGRVNLIGEHTDYTGGYVMPIAIPLATRATIWPSADCRFHFSSTAFPDQDRVITRKETLSKVGGWTDYAVGVLREFERIGIHPPPFVLRIASDIPIRAGLSSSASIEVATAVALLGYTGTKLSPKQIALMCQRAEHQFGGSPCGIMDQFAIVSAFANLSR